MKFPKFKLKSQFFKVEFLFFLKILNRDSQWKFTELPKVNKLANSTQFPFQKRGKSFLSNEEKSRKMIHLLE